jgi:N6-adenosine-specific RNA methylase IME4
VAVLDIYADQEELMRKVADPLKAIRGKKFRTILIDPPWQFKNRTGKIAPEHKRLHRYPTMTNAELENLPVAELADDTCHLYLWTPNALLPTAIKLIERWGFTYKTNIIWCKIKKGTENNEIPDPDRRGVGFYYRNVTEMLLLGIKGSLRTRAPARSQENFITWAKQEHSRKPPKAREIIKECSYPP